MGRNGKLVVVANRLPVRRVQRKNKPAWETSPGGLVSAIGPLLEEARGTWIGWPGQVLTAPAPFDHDGIRLVPVPLSRREVSEYYEGFSNATLWPLYHDCVRPPVFRREWWRPYSEVNRRFAEAIAAEAPRNGTVWIQDYQLQLVPGMLREQRPDLAIGFFLHIPFPPQELFSQLPWRGAILRGLAGADLVGFQTRVGAQNFGQLARRYAGAKSAGHGALELGSRRVRFGAFPISIDYGRFERQAASPATAARAATLGQRLGEGRRVLLGVDRLDYTKGIDLRLQAFGELIESGGATIDDCVLVQTAVPSRTQVQAYRRERERIEALVGEINGRYSSIGRVAVHYIHKNLPFEELVALYVAADVMIVTPLRDGMNLIAKEYVACRGDESGALVLSEFAGAAQELRSSVLVNPHDVDGLTDSLALALEMPRADQRRRMRAMRRHVRTHDVYAWARSFLDALEACPR